MVLVSRLVGRMAGMRPYLASAPAAMHDPVPGRLRVVVAGGGIAGASATVVLTERGIPVVVCEAAGRLGGHLGTHPRTLLDGTVPWIDHGLHGFFRQYYNWRQILRRISPGPAPLLHPLGSYSVISARWPDEQFDRLPPAPPLSILALAHRSLSLRLRELARADHAVGLSMLGFDADQTYAHLDQLSAEQLLAALRLLERARVMLFNVFAHSSFNDSASMSAAELVAMFHFYFLANPEGLGMDAPHADYYTPIWAPLRRYLEQRGVQIRTGTPVTAIDGNRPGHWRVHTGDTLTAEEEVLATHAGTAARILAASPRATASDQRLAAVAAQVRTGPPYAVARYWLDGDVRPERVPFTSIADPSVLDLVTLYHRFEAGARSWHERTGGSVVELHAYACPPGADATNLGATMLAELGRLWPDTRRLRQVDQYCQVGTDAAGFPVGGHATTPDVRTAVPGLILAGDWVATPFPSALTQRAAATGISAANTILAARGPRTEPVWSVPPRGILSRQRAAAMRRRPAQPAGVR